MPLAEYEASPREVRSFALLQLALTSGFLLLLFFVLGGTDADFPAWWLVVLLLVPVVLSAVLAERVWLQTEPVDPALSPDEAHEAAVGVFAAQTVRKLAICEASVIFSVVVAFVATHAAWPIVIGGLPALAVLAFEVWPSLRNVSISAAMLEADGADTRLVEGFRAW